MRIYQPSDRIPVQIGELKFLISPLPYQKKIELGEMQKMISGEEVKDYTGYMKALLSACVKGVEGVEDAVGQPMELEFGPDGELADSAFEVLFQLGELPKLANVAVLLKNQIRDLPELEGVKVELEHVIVSKKKATV